MLNCQLLQYYNYIYVFNNILDVQINSMPLFLHKIFFMWILGFSWCWWL